jgi:hypothetical protein
VLCDVELCLARCWGHCIAAVASSSKDQDLLSSSSVHGVAFLPSLHLHLTGSLRFVLRLGLGILGESHHIPKAAGSLFIYLVLFLLLFCIKPSDYPMHPL